jgi:toxin ParE1/3/4
MWSLGCAPGKPDADAVEVLFTEGAERDLEAIYDYVADFESPASAGHVLDKLLEIVETLMTFPERGSHPRELLVLGIRDYRQTFFKPYRRSIVSLSNAFTST